MKQGWEIKKLGEVLSLEYGKPLDADKRCLDGMYPVYGANGEVTRTNLCYYEKTSIIVGRKGTAGAVNITESKFHPLDVTYYVVFDDVKYCLKYLYYLLSSLDLPSLAKGVKPGINRNDVYAIKSAFPSLIEQERIVGILDSAFAKIDELKAVAEQNLQHARDLFQSSLRQSLTPKPNWQTKTINDVCDFFNGKAHENDIVEDGGYILINSKYISTDGRIAKRTDKQLFPLYKDDIVMVMSDVPNGKALAKCVLIYEDDLYSLNQRICAFRNSKVNVELLRYLISRNPYLLSFNNGENQTNLRKNDILKCPISYPEDTLEQQQIVEKLDALSDRCKAMEENYHQTATLCTDLKQALLKKAFNAEL